ncbi:PPE domain-containing protein [Actinocrispum wychmicini]|uniref:PPE family protein n=1 Tax=Actinocrispum wychmicini TaxID=1213861 RepID=A0A4R2KED3_9PSEU|nr:PPE domain-containing protein [Actinocrispum wychmicini]TCO64885.1 PPE family protein [Actinocrispum wychmicini]
MSVGYEIGDYRFDGFSNDELATMVDQIRQGPGSASMNRAVDALTTIANGLKQTDDTLRTELGKIGVEWTGDSSQSAQVVLSDSAQYGGQATGTITTSAGAVNSQGSDFSRARHTSPESGKLRGAKDYNMVDTMLLHTTDHAKEVQQTQAARQQAIDSMNGYADASRNNLGAYESLPVPPALNLQSNPVQHSTTGTGVQGFSPGATPLVPGAGGGGPEFTPGGIPGGGPLADPRNPMPLSPAPGVPGGGPGGGPEVPGGPGRMTGVGPVPGPLGTPPIPAPPGFRPSLAGLDTAVVGMAGGGGAGAAVGSTAEKDRVVRGPRAAGGVAEEGRLGGSRGSAAVGGTPGEEAAARAAERVGAKSKPGSSLMQPAAGSAQGEEDDEHVRKYGIEAEDVFADDRMVIPSVLGEDDDE